MVQALQALSTGYMSGVLFPAEVASDEVASVKLTTATHLRDTGTLYPNLPGRANWV